MHNPIKASNHQEMDFWLEPCHGNALAVRPASKLPPELADELHRHKTEIIHLLTETAGAVPTVALCKEWGAVPPYNLEMVTLKPTPAPANRDLITAYLSRQCAIGNPELIAWLTRRRTAYIGMTSGTWDASHITYAAARDAACWQLDRAEAKVWELLDGVASCVEDLKSKQIT